MLNKELIHDLIMILLHIFFICEEKNGKKGFININITSGVPGVRTPVASDRAASRPDTTGPKATVVSWRGEKFYLKHKNGPSYININTTHKQF